IGKRIGDVQELLAQIAAGQLNDDPSAEHAGTESAGHSEAELAIRTGLEHSHEIPIAETVPFDELDALTQSAGSLLIQLSDLQQQIRHTEQIRLLAQLAGGLAHQLRNAVTGARLAVQLHQRRCDIADDESLSVALRQLSLTEQQVRGLLTLGRKESRPAEAGRISDLIAELHQLVTPHATHAHVKLSVSSGGTDHQAVSHHVVPDAESFRLAVLNLTLNAIEAAGAGGIVSVRSWCQAGAVHVEVEDSGSGPPDGLRETLFDPFVTSKPEGVGLGLVLVRQSVHQAGGTIDWSRQNERTVFCLSIPLTPQATPAAQPLTTCLASSVSESSPTGSRP
ncbi:MAG: HAMP domain-containing sensor histidine kinase, partial [Planctomycetaceae bacterium]